MGGQESRSEDYTVYGFGADVAGSGAAGAAWAALALALVCTLVAGIAVLIRRGRAASTDALSWIPVPAAFLALGLLLLLLPLLTAQARFDVPGVAAGQYVLAPTWWSPAVFLAWGLLVEVSARFLAPYLLPFVPARLQRRARVFPPGPAPAGTEHSGSPEIEALRAVAARNWIPPD